MSIGSTPTSVRKEKRRPRLSASSKRFQMFTLFFGAAGANLLVLRAITGAVILLVCAKLQDCFSFLFLLWLSFEDPPKHFQF